MKNLLLSALALVVALTAWGQNRNPVHSPVVNPDGSVTFRVPAPKASSVELTGQFMQGTLPMAKDADGLWSVTVTPDSPDIYPYNFIIDSVSVSDPGNTYIFPNELFKASLLVMPDPDALYTVRNVPHGRIEYRTYPSHVLREERPLVVYLPPGYDSAAGVEYPVFYLVSGTTDTEETWYKVGRVNTILDNLIAAGEAEPMIVVMPYGYMNGGTPAPNTMEAADMYGVFTRELTECIMPYVKANYRIIDDRDHTAIAGFSRGGGQSMFAALSHPDRIGWLGSYSAYLTPEVMEKYFPNLKDDVNGLNMCWMCVGDQDFLYNDVERNRRYFDEQGIRYQTEARPGAHTWMHARHCLAQTARNLFKRPDRQLGDVTADCSTLDGFTIYRPTDLAASVAANGQLPIVVFGNGGCSHDSGYYEPMIRNLVDNGYLVIAVGESKRPQSVSHDFSMIGRDDHLIDAVDWACKANADPRSPFYQMLDCYKVAVSGHSCGGAQALAASYDPRITTTVMFNSGIGDMKMAGADPASLLTLHNPILYLIGGPEDVAYPNAAKDLERISHVPVAVANFPVGHGGTYGDERGGVLGDVALMWLDWQLKGRKADARFFTDSKWRARNYPDCVYEAKGIK